mmetsp:Transcript_37863/g.119648  ORF Transcript_37863/g.119648 Transcript_37863/m.119648 type:complete len:199 (-) Transcript_37863:153-749(-)
MPANDLETEDGEMREVDVSKDEKRRTDGAGVETGAVAGRKAKLIETGSETNGSPMKVLTTLSMHWKGRIATIDMQRATGAIAIAIAIAPVALCISIVAIRPFQCIDRVVKTFIGDPFVSLPVSISFAFLPATAPVSTPAPASFSITLMPLFVTIFRITVSSPFLVFGHVYLTHLAIFGLQIVGRHPWLGTSINISHQG